MSALEAAGPQAARIENLWWLFFWVSVAVQVLVVLFLLYAVYRGRRKRRESAAAEPGGAEKPDANPDPAQERRFTWAVTAAIALTVVALFVLLVASFSTGRALSAGSGDEMTTIEVTGYQWWWQVRYDDPLPMNQFTTANEIHVPVGEMVKLKLRATDVIHSFWVPNLHGKKDLLPGHETITWFRADKPGTYQGRCAEFCGAQHAHMQFTVVAEPREQYDRWLAEQRLPAAEPSNEVELRGREVFLSSSCVMCHQIQGTMANSRVGPPLTHVASRSKIGAGTLDNNHGNLAGWVVNPQTIKPGVRMPPNPMPPEDLHALITYLRGLK